ncbi:MAG: thioesterase [Acholeplasma sp.]|nr:thioesterase [Acholeplasma sp.]
MYEMTILVSNSHVDNNELMKPDAILNVLQDIEGMHIKELKTFTKHLNDNNLGVFLLYRQVEIIRKPKFGEKIIVSTYPYNTNIIGGYRHIYISNEAGEKLVKTNAFGAYVNLNTYVPTRIPKDIALSINDGVKDESIPDYPRKIHYDEDKLQFLEHITIRKSHIDRYNHVNNVHYVTFVLDAINRNIDFDRIRAEYLKSFRLHDVVNIYYEMNDSTKNKAVFVLKDNANLVNAVIEFSKNNS